MKEIKIDELREILEKTFPNENISENIRTLKLGDLESWDSLGNFNLLLAIEEFYDLRFSMDEIESIKSVNKIIEILEEKNG